LDKIVPKTRIIFYQDEDGDVPVLEWLRDLSKKDRKGYANCIARIQQLEDTGHELRRPAADYLRDGIYELRAKHIHVQYRILYFFNGQNMVILAHALIKEDSQVPDSDIKQATLRKQSFVKKPDTHTYEEATHNG
jgi:phage-related protein